MPIQPLYIGDSSEQVVYDFVSQTVVSINHNLGTYPNVSVIDENGYLIEASVQYIDNNTIEIQLTPAQTGKVVIG